MTVELSEEFVVFARTAGYTVEPRENTIEIYNLGGEIRHRVRRAGTGNEIASAERSRPYSVVAQTSTEVDAERYLTMELEGSFRCALGLPTIVTGYLTVGAREVAISHGSGISMLTPEREPHRRVQLRGEEPYRAAMFSHVMVLSLDELRASLAAEDGLPLYGFLRRSR